MPRDLGIPGVEVCDLEISISVLGVDIPDLGVLELADLVLPGCNLI